MKLKSKVAIVTGGASGIGRSISELFSQKGCIIVIADRVSELDSNISDIISKYGGEVLMRKVDVTKCEEINLMVDEVTQKYGKIDILVNNAGVAKIEHFVNGDEKSWGRIIDVNIKGILLMTRAVLTKMMKRNYGKIINIGSIAGLVGMEQQVVYGATKGAIIAFTKGLAIEMAPHSINVNCVCPGIIDTPMTKLGLEKYPEYFKKEKNNVLWKKLGKPEDVAQAVLFLASEDSQYLTGQTICVDGGYTRN